MVNLYVVEVSKPQFSLVATGVRSCKGDFNPPLQKWDVLLWIINWIKKASFFPFLKTDRRYYEKDKLKESNHRRVPGDPGDL